MVDEESPGVKRRSRLWVIKYCAGQFVGGAIIGIADALIANRQGEQFITNSWSYVPAEQWWLHGTLWGILFLAIFAFAPFLARELLRLMFGSGHFTAAAGGLFVLLGGLGGWGALSVRANDSGNWVAPAVVSTIFATVGTVLIAFDIKHYLKSK